MKKLSTLLFYISHLILSANLSAQDPYFSQFYANRVFLNPAYAGFEPGSTVTINYRDQWFGVPDGDIRTIADSYRTYCVTGELQKPCFLQSEDMNFGLALSAFRDEAGGAPLVTNGFGFAFSHEQALIRRPRRGNMERLDLRIGAQTSVMQKSLSGDYFIYSDQLDPVDGLLGDPSILGLRSKLFANLNVGVMLRGYHKVSKYKSTLFTVGFNFANLNQPNETLRDAASTVRLPRRTTFHFGFTKQITRFRGTVSPLYLAPQFRWDRQAGSKLNLHTIGTYLLSKGYYSGLFFQYNFPNEPPKPNTPAGGFITRNTSTLILNAGVDLRSVFDNGVPWRKRDSGILLGITYDLNLSGLTFNNTLGVIEINLRMNFQKDRKRKCGEIAKFELYKGECPVEF